MNATAVTSDSGDRDYYQGEIECIDAIAAAIQDLQGEEAFLTGQCLKYLWRWNEKHADPMEDLVKTQWYLRRLMQVVSERTPRK